MDFIRSIQNLQQKPPHIRKRILVVSVVVCMGLIVASWLMITNRRIDSIALNAPNKKAETKESASPFNMLKEIIVDTVEGFGNIDFNSFTHGK